MKKLLMLLPVLALMLSCQDEKVEPKIEGTETNTSVETNISTESNDVTCVNKESFDLIAGQHIKMGSVDVSYDGETLVVTYETQDDWELAETHLYVGDLAGLPVNKSMTPVPGKFPYKMAHEMGTKSYSYSIPLELKDSSCVIIAAHAAVQKMDDKGNVVSSETAWSSGTQFPGTNRWGFYSTFCYQKCIDTDDEDIDTSPQD